MHSKSQSVRVGPQSVLTRSGLLVQGLPQVLAHAAGLADLVFNTLDVVAPVLSAVFPNPVSTPLLDGTTRPSRERACVHYARNALQLRKAAAGSPESKAAGCAVLQWCGATVEALQGTTLPTREMPGLIVIEYLARHGAAALACSPEQWAAHMRWLLQGQTLDTFWERMEGGGHVDPKPAPVQVHIPRPEDLGAALPTAGHSICADLHCALA